MQKTSSQCLDFIKGFENFSSVIYPDAAGYPTIGYGHLLPEGEEEKFKHGITRGEAEILFLKDVKKAEKAVRRLIHIPLTQGQFDALVSFTFNAGAGALQRSTLRRKVNRAEHADVPAEFMKWVWSGGKRLKGLERRREAEGGMYGI
jgi:lysozyme